MRIPRIAPLAVLLPILAMAAPRPSLRIDAAAYDLGSGILQIAFTFANPGDSVLYLDCQVPPRASLAGGTLTLTFARTADAAEGRIAGGPPPSDSVPSAPAAAPADPEADPPQRIAGGQTFQGQRRLDRILGAETAGPGTAGESAARPKFANLRVVMAYYPERAEGEGPSFVVEAGGRVSSGPHAVARKGKPPAPPKRVRIYKTEP